MDLPAETPQASSSWLGKIVTAAREVIEFPINPGERIFVLYLLTAAALAAVVYYRRRSYGPKDAVPSSLTGFLFPKDVWSTRSAWLDVRYFFFHQPVRILISTPLIALFAGLVYLVSTRLWTGQAPAGPPQMAAGSVVAGLGYALVSTLVIDLAAYLMHRAQHKVPFLWEFHKVHHSLTVMHPLSNYREHPFDNAFYSVGTGMALGVLFSICVGWLGHLPVGTTVMGASLFSVLFYALGYNLRHSHVWLRWKPDVLNKVFGSPAHHQVHHSCHPDHIDKNFAFIFPFWDVMFGTYCLPTTNAQVRFGLGTGEEPEYSSCWRLYSLPFRKLWQRRKQGPGKAVARHDPSLSDMNSTSTSTPAGEGH